MGNTKSQPKETPISAPRGDIFGPPKAFNSQLTRVQANTKFRTLEKPKYPNNVLKPFEAPKYAVSVTHPFTLPRVPTIQTKLQTTTTLTCTQTTSEILRICGQPDNIGQTGQYEQFKIDPNKHASDQYEFERKLRRIRHEREKAELEFHSTKETPKPKSSINAICNFAKRYMDMKQFDLKYFGPKPDRPELTDDMKKVISDASRLQPPSEVLTQIDGVDLTRKDIHTLVGLNWLNDEVINAYLSLIVARGKLPGKKSIYAFNTFFYTKVRQSGYASVKRWTRKVDIFCFDFLLVPVHLGNHWCLAVIDFSSKTISYYDSMGGGTNGCCDTLLEYLKCESNDKKKQSFDEENWRLIDSYSEVGIPRQLNFSDCGVFACTFAEYLTRKAKLTFTQEHMPYFREKMIYELMTKSLLQLQ